MKKKRMYTAGVLRRSDEKTSRDWHMLLNLEKCSVIQTTRETSTGIPRFRMKIRMKKRGIVDGS